ncbi:MAG: response regulator [Myxococcota bacterium]
MNHRLLLVAGDAAQRDALVRSLGACGATVRDCARIDDVPALLTSFRPSVVALLGATPAESDVARLHALCAPAAAALVLVTSWSDVAGVVRALSLGVSGQFPADLPAAELLRTLQELVGESTDDGRFAAARWHHGAATLARIHQLLSSKGGSGELVVRHAGRDSSVPYVDGAVASEAGAYPAMLRDALHSPAAQEPWEFQFLPASTTSTAPPAAITVQEPAPVRCLLVDDDPDMRFLYSRLLGRAGLKVETAPDGRKGYEIALRRAPDVILSDLMMPGVDGWGLLSLVRQDFHLRETPFFVLSCHVEKLDVLLAANGCFPKGTRVDQIAARLQQAAHNVDGVVAQAAQGVSVRGELRGVGIQHLLDGLARARVSGRLRVMDTWSYHEVSLSRGAVEHAVSAMGSQHQAGREALRWLLTLDQGQFDFERSDETSAPGGVPFHPLMDQLCDELNELWRTNAQHLLADNGFLQFNPTLLDAYLVNSAPVVQEVVRSLVHGVPPRHLLAADIYPPLLVDNVVDDLLRRSVATLVEDPVASMPVTL